MKLNKKKIFELTLWTTIMMLAKVLAGIDFVIILGMVILITKD